MSVAPKVRVLVALSVLLGMVAFALAERAAWSLFVLLPAAGAGWWVTEGRRAARESGAWRGMPRWVTNIALGVVVLTAVVLTLRGAAGVTTFTTFLAALIVVKLWERRQVRDHGQLLTMSAFLTVGATLNDNSLGVGLLVLLHTPVLIVAVMAYQIDAARQRAREILGVTGATGAARGSGPGGVDSRRAMRWTTAGVMVGGLVVAAGVFVVVPRGLRQGALGEFARPEARRVSGFTNQVDLMQTGLISQSQSVVMDVQITETRTHEPRGGEGVAQYLRGAVLDEYRNGRWRASRANEDEVRRLSIEQDGNRLVGSSSILRKEPVRQVYRMRRAAPSGAPLFALNRVVTIRATSEDMSVRFRPDTWAFERTRQDEGALTYEVRSVQEPIMPALSGVSQDQVEALQEMIQYDDFFVRRLLGATDVEMPERLQPEDWAWFSARGLVTKVPPGFDRRGSVGFDSPAVRGLAERILRDSGLNSDPALRPRGDDDAAARALETYVRGKYTYTLDPPPVPLRETDPIGWFLTRSRRGHCEYYAAALAAMCRSVGIDARVVAGYLANEYAQGDEMYIVRERDAHAWVEVCVGPGLWRTYDATPASSPEFYRQQARSFSAWITRLLDSIEAAWNARIVAFDSSAQKRLFGSSGQYSGPERVLMELAAFRQSREGMRQLKRLGVWLTAIGVAVGAVGLAWGMWRRRRAAAREIVHRQGWAIRGHSTEAAALYGLLERTLRREGAARPAGMAVLSWARRPGLSPDVAPVAEGAAEALYAAVFGGVAGTEPLERARGELVRASRASR